MRFLYGMILGSFLSFAFGVALANAFPLGVDGHPDHLREQRARMLAEFDRDELGRKLERSRLDLDEYRRKERNPVHPMGVDVPEADKIAAPAVPLPTAPVPVTPNP